MNRATKALRVIEGMMVVTEPENKMLMACYKFAHVGLGNCGNAHQDWVVELDDMYSRLRREGVI